MNNENETATRQDIQALEQMSERLERLSNNFLGLPSSVQKHDADIGKLRQDIASLRASMPKSEAIVGELAALLRQSEAKLEKRISRSVTESTLEAVGTILKKFREENRSFMASQASELKSTKAVAESTLGREATHFFRHIEQFAIGGEL